MLPKKVTDNQKLDLTIKKANKVLYRKLFGIKDNQNKEI